MEKIVIVTKRDIKHHGGGGDIYVHEIAKRLVDEYEVTVLSSNIANDVREEYIDGIKIVRLSKSISEMRLMVPLYLAKHKFDFVVDNITVVPWFTPLYCSVSKTAIVHQLVQELFFYELPLFQATIAYHLERQVFKPYKNTPIVCPGGQSTIETLSVVGIPKNNVVSISGGCPPEVISICRNAWKRKAPYPLVVMLTRLEAYKHVDWAILAFAKVKRDLPKAKFVIIGWGRQEHKLKSLVNSLKLQDSVKFMGRMDGSEKIDLLMRAHVHLWSLSPRDGCGLSLIEASACGTPSLAWNVPGPKDTIVDGTTGFLLSYGDINALASKMEELLTNEELLKRLSIKSQDWASRNTWDHVATKFREHIKFVMSSWK